MKGGVIVVVKESAIDRVDVMRRILDAAATPVPEIREIIAFRHKVTGKTYGPFGVPFGVRLEDLERYSAGFAYVNPKNGSTYGVLGKSPEELRARHAVREQSRRADFAAHLSVASDEEFQSQAEYWLGKA